MRLLEALERFVAQLRADGRSVHTIGQYRRTIELLDRWLVVGGRSTELEAITHEVLADFLNSREVRISARGGPKRTITVNATRTSLRVFFAWVHDAGYVGCNAARLVRRAICSPPPPKALSDAEVDRLMSVLAKAAGPTGRRDHLLAHLLIVTGIRIGSAIALEVEDIDLANDQIWLRTLKGDRVDRVFLGRAIREHLVAYLARLPNTGPLFRGPAGDRLSKRQAQKRITQWMGHAGVAHGTPHALRHTAATRLLRRTGDLFLVKSALLHRSVASTAAYLSVTPEDLRRAFG